MRSKQKMRMLLGIRRENISKAELYRPTGQETVSDKVVHRMLRWTNNVSRMAQITQKSVVWRSRRSEKEAGKAEEDVG